MTSMQAVARGSGGKLLLCLALAVAAWMLSQRIPPLQSPDESHHLARAYLLAHGELTLTTPPGRMSGGRVDDGLVAFMDRYLSLAGQPTRRLDARERAEADGQAWLGEQHRSFFEMPGTGYYLPLVYLPQALGLRLGEWVGLSIGPSYQLARVGVQLSCLLLLVWSVALHRPPPLVLAVLLLPMSVFQFLSPTLDGLTTSLALLAISVFLQTLRTGRTTRSGAAWTLALSLLLVVTSRVHLLPMLLMPFFLFWRSRQHRDLHLALALALVSLAWVAYALLSTTDFRVARSHGTTEVLRHYLHTPMDFARVLWRTLLDADQRGFYARSFVGILGWLDAPLRPYFYPWLGAGLILCGLASLSWPRDRTDAQARVLLLLLAAASALLVFLALLLTWTPHPASVVAGVQGRYFVVPALLVAHGLAGVCPPQKPGLPQQLAKWLLLAVFAGLSLTALMAALQARYA